MRLAMAAARRIALGKAEPGSPGNTVDAVFLAAIMGRRVIAVIADADSDAAALAQAVGAQMEAAGAVVMAATALPGATLQDLLAQVAMPGRGAEAGSGVPGGSRAWTRQILQGQDAGLLTVLQAHVLDARVLESLLLLSKVETEGGRFVQVLLAGDAGLEAQLDRCAGAAATPQAGMPRWFLAAQPLAITWPAGSERGKAHQDAGPDRPAQASSHRPESDVRQPPRVRAFQGLRLFSALTVLCIAVTGAGLLIADRFWTVVAVGAIEAPVRPAAANQDIAPAADLAVTADHGPTPRSEAGETMVGAIETLGQPAAANHDIVLPMDFVVTTDQGPTPRFRSGETIVVRVKTTPDAFVYCYYMDGFGGVARIFPNRFQPDAFVPAGQEIEIPPSPDRPFNIRMDRPGQVEAVACLASPHEVEQSHIDAGETEDLTPIAGLELQDVLDAFDAFSDSGGRSLTMPIAVVAGPTSASTMAEASASGASAMVEGVTVFNADELTVPHTHEDRPDDTSNPKELLREVLEVERGDTLLGLLVDAAIPTAEAQNAIKALRRVYDPRTLKIGQEVAVLFETETGDRRLVGLEIEPNLQKAVTVARVKGDAYEATDVEKTLERRNVAATSAINSSLYEAGAEAGVPNGVMASVIRAFSYDVDFQRDIQPGDHFSVLFERFYTDDGAVAHDGDILFASLLLSGRETAIYRFKTCDGVTDYFNRHGKSVQRALLRTPVDGARLSSSFGMRRHPILGYSKMHKGADFAAASGTPVFAAGNGVIEDAGYRGAYGNYIRIKHDVQISTAYAHLSRFSPVTQRDTRVQQGDIIGYIGTTGRSTGPHLHYEVLRDGHQVNPMSIDLPTGVALEGRDLATFKRMVADLDHAFNVLKAASQVAQTVSAPGSENEGHGNDSENKDTFFGLDD
jgi:murein DD-endopeptidase MepM/ murein hydrolase activator NlpD